MAGSNPSISGAGEADAGGPPPRRRPRRALLLAGGLAAAALAGGGGLVARALLAPGAGPAGDAHPAAAGAGALPPPGAVHLTVPEVMAVLADPPRIGRLAIVLEAEPAGRGPGATEAELRHLAEELRRWLGTQTSAELHGAVALWTVRARALAIARSVLPDLPVRDALVKTLLLQ